MEWYDFGLYAFLAAYLAPNFFNSGGTLSGVLDVLLVFGIAFLFRPLGALILGPLGDRRGRLFSLVLTFAGMAVATFGVGIMPTRATIGVAAPILLVLARAVQGLSAGGESGISITYLTERAPEGRRGFFSSFVQASSICGFLLATLVVWVTTVWVGNDHMATWGWRIPFLLALPLGTIGLYARFKLDETSEFVALVKEGEVVTSPIRTALLSNGRVIVMIAAISAFQGVGYYTVYVFFSGYMKRLGFDSSTVSTVTTTTLIIAVVAVPIFGWLSDKIGRRHVLLAASGSAVILTIPLFVLMGKLALGGVVACQIVLALTVAAFNATTGATYAEMSEARTRAGSVTIGFNLGSLLFAAPTLYVMTLIAAVAPAPWMSGIYMAVAGLVSFLAVVAMFRSPMALGVRR